MQKKDKAGRSAIEAGTRNAAGLAGVRAFMPESADTAGSQGNSAAPSPGGRPSGPAAQGASSDEWRPLLRFEGTGGAYFGLLFKTFLLSLLTLGVYSFWGKTNQRRYLWSRTFLLGEPLEYTGTGKELFVGFLIVMPAFLALALLAGFIVVPLGLPGQLLVYILLLFAWQFALYRALRYRLTRTRWRGIRGNMSGSALNYAMEASLCIVLAVVSLGLLYPWTSGRLANRILNNVWFGSRKLAFSGSARSLFKIYLLSVLSGLAVIVVISAAIFCPAWFAGGENMAPPFLSFLPLIVLIAIVSFVVCISFYRAAFFRWLFEHARFGGMETRSTLSGRKMLKVILVNTVQVLCTFGLGIAWAVIRLAGARLNSVEYRGDPQLGELLQDTMDAPGAGEGLFDALDVDIAF